MIKGLLNDLKKMTVVGIILFLAGLLFNNTFTIFLGTSLTMTGYATFSFVNKEFNKLRKGL